VSIRYARTGDGVSLAYSVHGEGAIDLVLVPGFVSHLEMVWEEPRLAGFLERLSSFTRLILFDPRGQGLSDRPGTGPTLEEAVHDTVAVMDAAGCSKPNLLAVSDGGPSAIEVAARFQTRVERLILFASYARLLKAPDYQVGLAEGGFHRFWERRLDEWGGPVGARAFAMSRRKDPVFLAWWERVLRQGASPQAAANLLRMYEETDVRSSLSKITAPTLILQRVGDPLVKVGMARDLEAHIDGARLVELPGYDHLIAARDTGRILDEIEEFVTGERSGHHADRAVATVMFTDIVGSTELAARAGDGAWTELLRSHNALVLRQLELFGGRCVKTLGDGFLVTFDAPARAIQCARSLTQRVRELGIEIRVGLHTGELESMNGDVGGMAVNIGARVSALAGPGEVLVSRTVRDLVIGSDLEFADRGPCVLKGVPGEWQIYAVS
jgi:class 3 adenylate cyclase